MWDTVAHNLATEFSEDYAEPHDFLQKYLSTVVGRLHESDIVPRPLGDVVFRRWTTHETDCGSYATGSPVDISSRDESFFALTYNTYVKGVELIALDVAFVYGLTYGGKDFLTCCYESQRNFSLHNGRAAPCQPVLYGKRYEPEGLSFADITEAKKHVDSTLERTLWSAGDAHPSQSARLLPHMFEESLLAYVAAHTKV